ncbi:hypothetical protein LSAT2_024577 [Lamellibrachia satsuma]|nr:hypothetical protein LSAT2_024577 [Lamellibrachia satsuma]
MHPTVVPVVMLLCVVSFVEVLTDDMSSLRCYKCSNVKFDNPLVKKLFSRKSDQWCEHPSSDDATETCPSRTDYMCGYFEGSISFHVPLVGTSKVTVESRGCMKVDTNIGLNKCNPIGSDSERKFAGEVLSVLSEVSDVEVDGKLCACGTDLCDANCSGVAIGTLCLSLPVAIVLGILNVIIGLLLITCCCCCCCCVCCKNRRPAAITVNTGFPQVSMMSLPHASNNGHSVPPYSRLEEEPTFK